MKKLLALLLVLSLLLNAASCCSAEELLPDDTKLSDPDLLPYIEDTVYEILASSLSPETYVIESIQTRYISQEYIDELAFNSQSNIFFGYTLEELDAQFVGTRYVFTLGENGETTAIPFESYDNSYDRMIRNVAIGTGVILVCVTVSVVSMGAGAPAVAMVFAMAAKGGTIGALSGASIGGVSSAIVTGFETGDMNAALKAGALSASEGYKWGAITGAIAGFAKGLSRVGDTVFFKPGTPQAKKYWEGVKFTKKDGQQYPRFEQWAKKTVKFDTLPTKEAMLQHTGMSGNYYWDAKLANQMSGLSSTPKGYVWHHVEDMKTMLLIPQDLHSIVYGGMPHMGGASLIKAFLGN